MPRQLLHHFQRQNPGICPHVPRRECSTNRWPEGFWNAWVNPTMVRYMTYVINIYIFQYYIYTGIIQQCPVVLILNPKVRNFLEWIRNFSSWMELWWQAAAWDCLGLADPWIFFPGCKWPPQEDITYIFGSKIPHLNLRDCHDKCPSKW